MSEGGAWLSEIGVRGSLRVTMVCMCVQGLRAYLKEWLFVYVPGCKSVCMCVPMHGGGILACLPRVNHRRVRDTLALARWSWAAVGPAGVREAAAAGLALACSETSDALGAPSPVSRRTDPLERACTRGSKQIRTPNRRVMGETAIKRRVA